MNRKHILPRGAEEVGPRDAEEVEPRGAGAAVGARGPGSWALRVLAAFLLASLSAPGLPARGVREPDYAPGSPMPRDARLITGRLENGMAYYIRRNTRPAGRAELRLVVNAGSVLEDEDQRGLAHFVEHMAFNGTRHFAKQELVDWLESIGMRFGPETNAYTSFDETVYQLEVPTDREGTLEKAFLILEDWARGLTLDPGEVEKERGVILEEWRLGRGASARVRDRQFPTLLAGSLYAERLPIGDPQVIRSAPREALERFYRDWYRPDLSAVVAVGDFDADQVERMVRRRFSRLENPPAPRPRPEPAVPGHRETLVSVALDPELTGTTIGLYAKREARRPETVGDYRSVLAERLFFHLMDARLDEESRRPEAPFLYAAVGASRLARPARMYYAAAAVDRGGAGEGFAALVRELQRVRVHGFTPTEMERARAELLRGAEQSWRETENLPSGSYAAAYVSHFLEGSPVPGPEYARRLAEILVPGIREEEVRGVAGILLEEADRVALVGAPGGEGDPAPREGEILAAIRDAAREETAAYRDDAPAGGLMEAPPAPGAAMRVDGETARAAGAAEWRLGNGARVILKTTDFKNDEVLLTAFSPGGTSLAEDGDFLSADFAENLAAQSGYGGFSRVQLEKVLSGRKVSLEVSIGELTENLEGSSSTRDLEEFFQMIYLTFTDSRLDPEAARAYLRRVRVSLADQENEPVEIFRDTLREVLSGGNLRGRPLKAADLDRVDPEKSFAFLRDRFADAGDFTFIFVGSVSPGELEPFIARYLASLPGGAGKETWRDRGMRLPRDRIDRTVRAGMERKSLAALYFTGDLAWSYDAVRRLDILGEYLELRLREVLREDQGGTYGVSVQAEARRFPAGEYSVGISFGADPGRVEELTALALAEIRRLGAEPPEEKDAAKIREQALRLYQRNLRENSFYLSALRTIFYHNLPGNLVETRRDFIARISPAMLQEAIRSCLDPSRLVKVVLLPARGD